jgi:hypothetical protein
MARRRWAALIKRIWQVDPLQCPRCGGAMKIVSIINPGQRDVIDRILTHCSLSSRAPPAEARGPPEPSIPKLTYVSDARGFAAPLHHPEPRSKPPLRHLAPGPIRPLTQNPLSYPLSFRFGLASRRDIMRPDFP